MLFWRLLYYNHLFWAIHFIISFTIRIQQKNNNDCYINNKEESLLPRNQQQLDDDDILHRNRLQWLLVHIGCGRKFTPYTPEKNDVILTLGEAAHTAFVDWIYEAWAIGN